MQRIPPLVLQPLVENSIKHGIAPRKAGGAVIVAARLEHDGPGADGGVLHLSVVDTGIGCSAEQLRRRRVAGIGLSNIERRLERYYGKHASLEIRSAEDVGTTVEIRLPTRSGTGAQLVGAPS
jgi:sensor histidine kinase YesM